MKTTSLCLFFILFLTASCGGNLTTNNYIRRTGAAEALAPTRIGMTLEQAYAAIGGNAQFVRNSSGAGYNMVYYYKIGNYAYQVISAFSPEKKVSSISMIFSAAYESAESASECGDFFKIAVDGLKLKYGSPDFAPKFHNENGNIVSKAIFTFSDSTSVHVNYSYPQNGGGVHSCVITIAPVEQWHEFQSTNSPIVPLMRTPWSRFK